MSVLWRWVISLLVWLSADHERIATEPARAAAAVSAARASIIEDMAGKPVPPAPPGPAGCKCSATCVRGIWKPDGTIQAKCPCSCARCVAERAKGKAGGSQPTPLFDAHAKACKQCASLLDESGSEQGLCQEGYRLWLKDVRPVATGTCSSGTCPPR